MPIKIRKVKRRNCYSVKDKKGRKYSKCTSLKKAKAQKRLLDSFA